jgi:hypothetical protein
MPTLTHRRAIGNSIALKMGGPTIQEAIDARWAGIVAGLNGSMPSSPVDGRTSQRPASRTPQGQGDIDSMWSALATGLNKKSGLKTPVMDRAR